MNHNYDPLLWAAAIDPEQRPSIGAGELSRYRTQGALVFVTATFAMLCAYVAMTRLAPDTGMAMKLVATAGIGVVWALIDRSLLLALSTTNPWLKAVNAGGRVLLAIFASSLVANLVVLNLFADRLAATRAQMQTDAQLAQARALETLYGIDGAEKMAERRAVELEQANAAMQVVPANVTAAEGELPAAERAVAEAAQRKRAADARVAERNQEIGAARKRYEQEAQNARLLGLPAPAATDDTALQRRLSQAQAAQAGARQQHTAAQTELAALQQRIRDLRAEAHKQAAELVDASRNAYAAAQEERDASKKAIQVRRTETGASIDLAFGENLVADFEALQALRASNSAASQLYFQIMLLLIAIELLPVLFKIGSPGAGNYEKFSAVGLEKRDLLAEQQRREAQAEDRIHAVKLARAEADAAREASMPQAASQDMPPNVRPLRPGRAPKRQAR